MADRAAFAVGRYPVSVGELVDLLPAWQLPVPEAEWLQALTLPQPLVPEAAQALVRFVALRLAAGAAA